MATETGTAIRDSEFVDRFQEFYPEPLVFAVLLGVLALLVTAPSLPLTDQLELFTTGFYDLFRVQMALLLWWLLSATVVESRPFGAMLDAIAARVPTSQRAIVGTTTIFALVGGWINWAVGLIGGVYLGRRLTHRARNAGVAVHYPTVLFGGLLATVTAYQGLTSPAGLLLAETGSVNPLGGQAGVVPLGATIFDPSNLLAGGVLLVSLPLILVTVTPDGSTVGRAPADDERSIAETFDHYEPTPASAAVPADRLEDSRVLTAVVVLIGLSSISWQWLTGSGVAMLGTLFTLVMVGLLFQQRPMAFVEKISHGTRWIRHLAVPFLFYAGTYALLAKSGLYAAVGTALANTGLPAASTYLVSLLAGLLVVDPGSLWVLLGPAVTQTGTAVSELATTTMFGAGLSNLWLSFLFLRILGVEGIETSTFLRYATGVTVYVSAVVVVAVTVF
jgi:short subunit fatty acids transporter